MSPSTTDRPTSALPADAERSGGANTRYHVTSNYNQLRLAVQHYRRRDEPLLFDTETTGLDPLTNKLVMVQLAQPSSGVALILDWRRIGEQPRLERAYADVLRELFSEKLVVGHNLKFDAEFLLALPGGGVPLNRLHDTMLGEQLLSAGLGRDISLAGTLKRRFGTQMDKTQRTWFYDPAPLDARPEEWNAPFPEEELTYAALDVTCLPRLYEEQRRDLKRARLSEVAAIEMRALPAIAAMELRGIRVEQDGWREFIAEQADHARAHTDSALTVLGPLIVRERIESFDAARSAWEGAKNLELEYLTLKREDFGTRSSWGEEKKALLAAWRAEHPMPSKPKLDTDPPNIGSQKQLIVGMKALGIAVPTKRNEKGEKVETTDSDNLEKLAPKHEVIRQVLDARKAQKFVDAFGEKLLSFVDARGRIHPDYHQIGADTGRMSCSKPNWQQVPARGEGARLRSCVIADPGHQLITADFSNIELRIIADLSGDEQMLAMFASGQDLHNYTARLMFGLDNEVDPKTTEWRDGMTYRQAAKIVNYLIPYGGSAYAIAMQNNMAVKDAEELVDKWYGMFPQAQRWMERLKREVHGTLESHTASGRTRSYIAPLEPGRPATRRDTKPEQKRELWANYQEALREYKKQWASIERQARNSPVQGLSADITKLAVALFYEHCDRQVGCLVAVVHDELVVEAPEMHAGVVRELLADAMDEAAQTFLKRVALPRPEPTISDHWTHD